MSNLCYIIGIVKKTPNSTQTKPKPKPKKMPGPKAKTNLDVDTDLGTKEQAKPDPGLMKLYTNLDHSKAQFRKVGQEVESLFIQVVEYVKKNKLSRGVVRATLEERGLSEPSVNSELSRIFKFASTSPKSEEVFSKLKNHEISIADARKEIAKPQSNPARAQKTVRDRVYEHLAVAAKIALNDLQKEDGEKTFASIQDFTALAGEAWREYQAVLNEKAKELQPAEADEDTLAEEEEELETQPA